MQTGILLCTPSPTLNRGGCRFRYMYSEREHMEKTINELLEAYKKSYEAQSSLVKAKDAMINFLEAHIDKLKLELSQCKKDSMSSTGLTDEEFEELEKLTEEIMKEDCKGSIKVYLGDESFFHEAVESVNKMIKTQKNTTTDNSDVLEKCNSCGQVAERLNAQYCFKCGTKLVGKSNLSK